LAVDVNTRLQVLEFIWPRQELKTLIFGAPAPKFVASAGWMGWLHAIKEVSEFASNDPRKRKSTA